MKVFDFDPAEHRATYVEQGWIHIPGGVAPGFRDYMREFVAKELGDHLIEGAAIGGKGRKNQAVFEFPEDVDFPGEVFDAISVLCGLDRARMTLSERHVNAYFEDSPPEPVAHKDRHASQVSVGLSIDIPAASRVVLYPFEHRELNPFNISFALPESLPPERSPEIILRDAREVEVDDSAGDVLAFPGSSIWHLRRRPAGAVILYLKMNDFGSDPLGEDPSTPERRSATLAALADRDGALDGLVPVLARRLDTITRRYGRDGWQETVEANVWEQKPVPLADWELHLLQALDGRRTASDLLRELPPEVDEASARQRLRELAQAGVVDLNAASLP